MSNPPRKHHFLPEFYTKQWLNSGGQLVRYTRPVPSKFDARWVAPGGIGFEMDLYSIPGVEPSEAQVVETAFMSPLDNLAAEALALLLDGKLPESSRLRSAWTRFLLGLLYRTPEDVAGLRASYAQGWLQLEPEVQAEYERLKSDEHPDRFSDFIDTQMALDQAAATMIPRLIDNPAMGTTINNMAWAVADLSASNLQLLTSDRPLTRYAALGHENAYLVLPISPSALFIASRNQRLFEVIEGLPPRELVRRSNRSVVERAVRFVLAQRNDQRHFVEANMGKAPIPGLTEVLARDYAHRVRGPGVDTAA